MSRCFRGLFSPLLSILSRKATIAITLRLTAGDYESICWQRRCEVRHALSMGRVRRLLLAGVLLAACWTEALAIGPVSQAGAEESASQHNTLGIKLANAGQLQAALKEFLAAAGLLPGNAGVAYNLAVTYQKLGETAEA